MCIKIKDFAEKNDLNIYTVYARLSKGLTPEEVLCFKWYGTKAKSVEYNGKIYPSRLDFANEFNIPYEKVTAGLNAGHTPEQIIEANAIEKIDGRENPKQPIEFDGKLFETQRELAEEYGVDIEVFRHKLYCGLSVEEALGLYDSEPQNLKDIWLEFLAEDEEVSQNNGYDLLRDFGLDKNTNASDFDEIEDSERHKWMYIK